VKARPEIFGPETAYEREGDVGYVTFPCGYTIDDDGETINVRLVAEVPD